MADYGLCILFQQAMVDYIKDYGYIGIYHNPYSSIFIHEIEWQRVSNSAHILLVMFEIPGDAPDS